MTLIIKELVIRGVISKDPLLDHDLLEGKETLDDYLKKVQRDIKKECIDAVLSKLEAKKNR